MTAKLMDLRDKTLILLATLHILWIIIIIIIYKFIIISD